MRLKAAGPARLKGSLSAEGMAQARRQGEEIIHDLAHWPDRIGDWRSFRPLVEWQPMPLPPDWAL